MCECVVGLKMREGVVEMGVKRRWRIFKRQEERKYNYKL